jgi:hypothetical protein
MMQGGNQRRSARAVNLRNGVLPLVRVDAAVWHARVIQQCGEREQTDRDCASM